MKITISGTLGSGKSTIGKMLAEKLNYNYYYAGGMTRKMAEERGMSLLEFTKLREKEPSLNLELDKYQEKIGKTEDNFIMDGHLGFHFIPDSVKIFLKCSKEIASERILKSLKEGDNQRKKEGLNDSAESIINSLNQRHLAEVKQYVELYKVDIDDESNFDIVIDTSKIPPGEVCQKALDHINSRL